MTLARLALAPRHVGFKHALLAITILTIAAACTEPIEPGSDLPDPAPPAALGEAPVGLDITGTFALSAQASSDLAPMPIPLDYLILWTQQGEPGEVEITTELRDPSAPEMPGRLAQEPSPLTEQGTFSTTLEGIVIPKEAFTGMFTEDGLADLELEAIIASSNCVTGDLNLKLTAPFPITLSGPFVAERQDIEGGCDDQRTTARAGEAVR